jgi:putative ABC transport system permease protein
MIRSYVKIAWRNLLRHPSTSLIHVLGLSLGIIACMVIFLMIRFELGFDRSHPDGDRIYRVTTRMQGRDGQSDLMSTVPGPATPVLRDEFTGLEAATYFHTWTASVKAGSKKFEPRKEGEQAPDMIVTDPSYFSVFSYQWLAGNPQTALAEPFKVVLTRSQAARYFGDIAMDQIMGRELVYEDSLHLTVSGIVADPTHSTDLNFHDFISVATVSHSFLQDDIDLVQWGMFDGGSQTFIRLAPGTTLAQVQRQTTGFVHSHFQLSEGEKAFILFQPLRDLHFNGAYHDSYSRQAHLPTLYGLMGIALFILTIACINFVNLSTAQSIQRAREIGVRKVLGSGRKSLVLQFLSETAFLTTIAVLLSLLLLRPLLMLFHGFLPEGLPVHFLSPSTLLFLLGLVVVTTVAAGFYPAKVLSSFLPALSLKGQGSVQLGRKSFLRKALIVFQFTVSLMFIVGTLVVGRQIHFMLDSDLGFAKDAIVNIRLNRHFTQEERSFFSQRVSALPGVTMVSLNGGTPSAERHSATLFSYTGGKDLPDVHGEFMLADAGYMRLYQLKLLAGRNVMASDTMKELVVNETGARALGFRHPEDALGKMIHCSMSDTHYDKTLPIVGIIADFHSRSLHSVIQPDFLISSMENTRVASVKLDTKGEGGDHFAQTMHSIESVFRGIHPDDKFDYVFFDDVIARFYKDEQKTSRLIQTAMGVAIFISCMGLFGLAAFTAQQRTKEIGIRKVLGASVPGLITLLCKDFVALVGLAILIASPLAWLAMHRWLENYAYRVSISAWIFVAAGVSAMGIALITVGWQAFKVARANPVGSLKSE